MRASVPASIEMRLTLGKEARNLLSKGMIGTPRRKESRDSVSSLYCTLLKVALDTECLLSYSREWLQEFSRSRLA